METVIMIFILACISIFGFFVVDSFDRSRSGGRRDQYRRPSGNGNSRHTEGFFHRQP